MTMTNEDTRRNMLRDVINAVASWDRRNPDEPYPWDEFQPLPLAEASVYLLDEMLVEAGRMKRAADAVAKRIRDALLADVEAHSPIRIGDTVYASVPDRQRRLVDSGGFKAWLGEDWINAVRVDAGNVRITTVRQIAEQRGLDPKAVEETFFDWYGEEDARRLQPYPVNGASTPKWAKELPEGMRRGQ